MKHMFLLVFILCCYPLSAHAYLDPGTGSMIFQAVAAIIAVSLVFIKNLRVAVIGFFKSFFGKKQDENNR